MDRRRTGEHGDLLDLIAGNRRLASLADTLDEARRYLSLPPPEAEGARAPTARADRVARGRASALAHVAADPRHLGRNLPAQTRHHRPARLWLPALPPTLLVSPDADDAPGTPEAFPALIAAVRDIDGRLTGLHRTWLASGLDPSGGGKAPVATPRRALGELLGHGVRFGHAGHAKTKAGVMVAGEGIETILSLRQILPAMPMIAALSAAHLAAVQLPPTLRRLYIARDNDAAGRQATATLADKAREAGMEPLVLDAQSGDFNDDLRQLGTATIRANLRTQRDPEDAERLFS